MDIADLPRVAEIARQAHDSELAETTRRLGERLVALNPSVVSIRAANGHVAGLLERDAARLTEAADLYAEGGRPLARALALEHAGCIHIDDGEVDRATRAFDPALVLLAEAGAAWDANRLLGRLRTLGVRRRLVAAARPSGGWDSLTDGELAVARLVAAGLTNREAAGRLFVSQHTVSGHLRSVFVKLNVNSRVDLARVASQRAVGG